MSGEVKPTMAEIPIFSLLSDPFPHLAYLVAFLAYILQFPLLMEQKYFVADSAK